MPIDTLRSSRSQSGDACGGSPPQPDDVFNILEDVLTSQISPINGQRGAMPRRRRAWRTASCLLLLSQLVACGGDRPSFGGRSSGDTLWVGVAVGLTSPERYVNVFEGVQLALDQLNQQRPSGSAPARPVTPRPAPIT